MNYESKFQEIEQFYQQGEIEKAIVLLQEFEKQTEKEGNMFILTRIWQWLIMLYQYQGKLNKAVFMADKALKKITDKNSAGYCDILKRRGFLYYLNGDVKRFLSDVNFALRMAEKNGYELEKAGCLGVLGIYYQQTDHNFKKALDCYQQAIEIKKKLGNKEGMIKLKINIGTLYKEMKQFEKSKQFFEEALEATKEKRLKINCHLEIGRLFYAQNNFFKAKEEIELALQTALLTKFVNEQGDCYRELARIAKKEGEKDNSQRFYQKALEIYESCGYSAKAEAIKNEMSD